MVALSRQTKKAMVKSQPFPIALISGCATMAAPQPMLLRTRLVTATPLVVFRGTNSVITVVVTLEMSMNPKPKKKFAINYILISSATTATDNLHFAQIHSPAQARIHVYQLTSPTTARLPGT